ncbi:phosphonate ABC transporter ATP-binding protein [Arenicella sp. 4NH20-0111]|uniref:phosphonate ABC transporter ATP-binding protein n=1 Tax=Arenicella sp. 4NH20-0111 TaxID=3127648 RepID=UPI003104113A
MLQLKSVTKVYPGNTKAVNDITVSIPNGEFCVLLGPSGAGKSTLMGLINGLVLPTSGSVVLNDEQVDARNQKKIQQRISMIHQQLHLIPRLSMLHNVLSGKLYALPLWRVLAKHFPENDQRRACRLLAEVDLTESQLHRRVSALSGGQQQRVAIARAFMARPEIVLADEPVASLDPTVSRSVLASLRHTSKQNNTTVVCSLHQVDYALEFADRIIAMREGKIVFDGPPQRVSESELTNIYGSSDDHKPAAIKAVPQIEREVALA